MKSLSVIEEHLRRFMLMVGLGLVAFGLGSSLALSLAMRWGEAFVEGSSALRYVIAFVVENVWVTAVLPALAFVAARFLSLPPWRTALVSVFSGLAVLVVLQFVTTGFENDSEDFRRWGARVLGGALGAWMTQRAVRLATSRSEATQKVTTQKAGARKADYEAFLAQASGGESAAPSVSTTSGSSSATPEPPEQK